MKTVALSINQTIPDGIFGLAEIDAQPFPMTPSILIYNNEAYAPFEGYGQAVPGHPEIDDIYFKTDSLVVAPSQIEPFPEVAN